MRFTVPAVIMCTIGALLSIVLGVQPVLAGAGCTNNNQCPSNQACQSVTLPGDKTPYPGLMECREGLRCNVSSECPSNQPFCVDGVCRVPASSGSGGGSGGGGGGQSGVGQACGQVKIGGVTKPKGCKPGLQCVKVPASSSSGTCRELAK
jgi:hypothetical protein